MGDKKKQEKKPVMGIVMNKNNSPRNLFYDGEEFVISPREKVHNLDKSKLSTLPKKVIFFEKSS